MRDALRNQSREYRAHKNEVFLIYSSKDSVVAKQWITELRREGVNVVFDSDIVKPGDQWESKLADTVSTANAIIWLLTEDSISSQNVNKEIVLARDRNEADKKSNHIIPVAIKNYNPIPYCQNNEEFNWLLDLDIEGTRSDEGPQISSVLEKLRQIDVQLVAGVRRPALKWIGPCVVLALLGVSVFVSFINHGIEVTFPSLSSILTSIGLILWFTLWWYNLRRRSDKDYSTNTELATLEYDEPDAPIPVYANKNTAIVMLLLGAVIPFMFKLNPILICGFTIVHISVVFLYSFSVQQRLKIRLIPIGTLGILLLPVDALKIVSLIPIGITLTIPTIYDLVMIAGIFVLGLVIVYDIYHRNLGLTESQQPMWLLFLITAAFGALAYYSEANSQMCL